MPLHSGLRYAYLQRHFVKSKGNAPVGRLSLPQVCCMEPQLYMMPIVSLILCRLWQLRR